MKVLFPTVRLKRCHNSKWVPFCAALLMGGLQAVYASQTIDSGTTTWSGNGTVNGDLVVGSSGTGTLKVTANTTNVSGGNSYFGSKAGSLGTVQITGGTLGSGNLTEVGDAGKGILNISGGTLTTGTLLLGNNATGNGTVTLSSGTLKSDQSDTIIGNSGTGTFSQSGGYFSSVANLQIGKNSTGVGSATLTGGTTVIAKAINVGVAGAGSLTVAGSAIMQVGSGTVALGGNTGGMGTLNLGNGGAFTGVLSASTGNLVVTTGSGAGTVNFNTSNAVSYGYRIQGNLSVNQIGSGTTTLTGSSNYTGLTSITSGELDVNGSLLNDNYNGTLLNTGTIAVSSGGVLGGSGTVGIVNVTNGSIKGSGLLASLATFRGISTLSGTSTLYHGFTVASGTLNFSGVANIAGNDGAAHIASGATMKSTGGTIGEGARGVISSTGGTLVVESGTLSAFYLSLDSASTLQMQISGSNGSTTGELDVTNLSLAGTLDLTGLGNLTVIGTTITLINLQQGSLINTIFDAVTVSGTSVTLTPRQSYYYPNAEYEETFTTSDGAKYELTYKGGSDGADITVTLLAVPEPSTWALLLGGMGMLWQLRLRNRWHKANGRSNR